MKFLWTDKNLWFRNQNMCVLIPALPFTYWLSVQSEHLLFLPAHHPCPRLQVPAALSHSLAMFPLGLIPNPSPKECSRPGHSDLWWLVQHWACNLNQVNEIQAVMSARTTLFLWDCPVGRILELLVAIFAHRKANALPRNGKHIHVWDNVNWAPRYSLESESESVSCSVGSDSLLWTVAHQPPLSVESSRQEYWRRLPCPSLGDLSDPGIEPGSPTLQADSLLYEPPGKPQIQPYLYK